MNAEDQIRKLKEIKPLTKEEKTKNLKTSIVLTLSTLISVLFLVYAFNQKQEADSLREVAVQAKIMADEQRALAEEQRKMAMAAQSEAERQRALAEEQRALALQALENCKKGK